MEILKGLIGFFLQPEMLEVIVAVLVYVCGKKGIDFFGFLAEIEKAVKQVEGYSPQAKINQAATIISDRTKLLKSDVVDVVEFKGGGEVDINKLALLGKVATSGDVKKIAKKIGKWFGKVF